MLLTLNVGTDQMFLRGWGIFTTCVFNELFLGDVDDWNGGVGADSGFLCCRVWWC